MHSLVKIDFVLHSFQLLRNNNQSRFFAVDSAFSIAVISITTPAGLPKSSKKTKKRN